MKTRPTVLVLGGGPDAEQEVSLRSARAIADALESAGDFAVEHRTIDRLSLDDLTSLPGDVIFPALHGGWGEGGPLQDLMEADGRPFVGSGSLAARTAMDKIATKFIAASLGVLTPTASICDLRDPVCPRPYPVVVKPVHEGSTIGLFICRDDADWTAARRAIEDSAAQRTGRVYMIEPCIVGAPTAPRARELTVGWVEGVRLPIIEITPAEGLYDYQAKYNRTDTRYVCDPALPPGVAESLQQDTRRIATALGVRHLARADYMLDGDGRAWFLEINTLPGFTDHSLVPMAARHVGVEMPALCTRLVSAALGAAPPQTNGHARGADRPRHAVAPGGAR